MSTVLIPHIITLPESTDNIMPKHIKTTLNKCKFTFEVNPVKIEQKYFDFINEEIDRRAQVEHRVTNDNEDDELIYDNANYDSDMEDLNVFEDIEEEEMEI